ncbi:endoplasmic reticulum metallopeptidase 1-like [Drosophila guanche]|uniref:FXNA-like protease n=1 Tax=Drosophila guanche TaxID=7266 RepID=A0A3B0JSU2_DROGU|nr:endoplasmic reticulum metallopeptidase 1-like [Drosophila guanche]SPP74188.1 blast:Endoplasmic reticulum metallopeptidase 1 [Drosophila guanche]
MKLPSGKDSGKSKHQSDLGLIRVLSQQKELRTRLPWYYAPSFLLLWVALFYAVVIPLYHRLPNGISIKEESLRPGEFVSERAQRWLYKYDRIGPKVVGSVANEVTTVAFILDEVESIRTEMRSNLYDLETDVQAPAGAYMHWKMVNMYQGVQNVVVKLSTKSSNSTAYLLVNSHFDSKPSSPGAGDDGTMVVVMLEVLRQMAISETPFEHPIVFLFNGAEENPLEASHGFITQHKWAANCKALINLEVAGSGGRDLLFQSGPNNPWLMKYYNQNAKHPFATTMAEEIFQSGILPSDTDFRIFREYGQVPGLDIAQISNGYVYHTKFDNFEAVPGDSLQNAGENALALVRAFANASEMHNPEEHSEGHSVFFDFLGLFFVYYTETTGIILNCVIAVFSLVLVGVSLWRMARFSEVTAGQISLWFAIILGLHVVGFLLSLGLPLLMGVLFDAGDRSLTYFSNNWLVIGLYICPAMIGQVLPLSLYYTLKPNNKISHPNHLHMSLHAHCVLLALIAIILTAISLRTPYLCMLSMLFYAAALLINLLSTLHDRGYYWVLIVQVLQLMPFLYFCHLYYMFLVVLFPMLGRFGHSVNPDLLVALLCALGTFFAMGFVAPLINMFRWPKLVLLGLGVVTFIFSMIAVSEVGFPYRAATSVMRVHFLHVRRIFYEYDGAVSLNDSGYYFDFQDRRLYYPLEDTSVNLTGLVSTEADCSKYLMCGVPCFNHRWCTTRSSSHWLPRDEPVAIPAAASLQLLSKTILQSGNVVRYEFEMSGPPHMRLYIQPLDGVTVEDWSFIRNMLDEPDKYSAPYHIFFSYGRDSTPLKFHIDFAKSSGNFDVPVFELGFSAHFLSYDFDRDAAGLKFIKDFPDFAHPMEWPTLFVRYVF